MSAISSNGFSHDMQAVDAMDWLKLNAPDAFHAVTAQFPEYLDAEFDGSWFDTDAMRVDVEWSSWLVDAIEDTGYIYWEDGEPWADED